MKVRKLEHASIFYHRVCNSFNSRNSYDGCSLGNSQIQTTPDK